MEKNLLLSIYKYIFLFIILLTFKSLKAQLEDYEVTWFVIDFERGNNAIQLDSMSQSIWQIRTPQKTFFNAAFSGEKAIVTDALNNYPTNNYSFFDLYGIKRGDLSMCLEIKHKIDSDSLKDGGYITISYDSGNTWMNIIEDSLTSFEANPSQDYNYLTSNLYGYNDTLFNGEYGFSGHTEEWVTTKFCWMDYPVRSDSNASLIIRFNFISDAVETNKEGWLIDDIRNYYVILGGSVSEIDQQNKFEIWPNPMQENARVEIGEYHKAFISVYNIHGQLFNELLYENNQPIIFEKERLERGIYIVSILADGQSLGHQKLIVE